jgi:endonuclease YncB( thermonuclease family)
MPSYRDRKTRREWGKRRARGRSKSGIGLSERVALVIVSLAFIAVFAMTYWQGVRQRHPLPTSEPVTTRALGTVEAIRTDAASLQTLPADSLGPSTKVSARSFVLCFTGGGTDCVVDGDTLWVDGVKIRVADIDAPETHPPRCGYEAQLGDRATRRLLELVNAGGFELTTIDRNTDRYGRELRRLIRNGQSLGEQLVLEGLARRWDGARHPWCRFRA